MPEPISLNSDTFDSSLTGSTVSHYAKQLLVIAVVCIILLVVYLFIQNNSLSSLQIVNGSFQGVQDGISYNATLACTSNNGDNCWVSVTYNPYCPADSVDPICPAANYQYYNALPSFQCSGNSCSISEGTSMSGSVDAQELSLVFDGLDLTLPRMAHHGFLIG